MRIGQWDVDFETGEVRGGDAVTSLAPKATAVLRHLVEHADELVTTQTLHELFWNAELTSENAAQKAISEIRRALGEDPRDPVFIHTLARRGYMFRTPVGVDGSVERSPAAGDREDPPPDATLEQPRDRAASPGPYWKLAGGCLTLGVALVVLLILFRPDTPDAQTPLTSIVVLPFDDMTPASDQGWLVGGITEALTESLARIEALRVVSRTSAQAVRQEQLEAGEIGQRLNVGTLVEGSLRRSGDNVRITVQLIRAVDGAHLWSANYDRKLQDALILQSEVAKTIAEAIRLELGLDEGPSFLQRSRYETPDVRAYELLRKGTEVRAAGGPGHMRAMREYALRAIEIDPNYAAAHAQLAYANYFLRQHYYPEPGLRERAIAQAHQALSLDPNEGSANNLLVEVAMNDGNWAEAEARARRAIAANPDHGPLRHSLSVILANHGRLDEALIQARRADALDAFKFVPTIAVILMAMGDTPGAIQRLEATLDKRPKARIQLVYGYAAEGRQEEALALLAADNNPELGAAFRAAVDAGDLAAAVAAWIRAQPGDCSLQLMPFGMTTERERFFVCLTERVETQRSTWLMLPVHPAFDPFRDDPRFEAHLRYLNLSESGISRGLQ